MKYLLPIFIFSLLNYSNSEFLFDKSISLASPIDSLLILPLGGNTWVHPAERAEKFIDKSGIINWKDPQFEFDTYLHVSHAGMIHLGITARTDGSSNIQVSIGEKKNALKLSSNKFSVLDAGDWQITDSGYVRIHIEGISKSGSIFADISQFELSGSAIDNTTSFVRNNDGNFFYWGRRGPSAHLNYIFPDSIKASWFYNEVTVPIGQDIIGSYFMANGFGEGYFGMQVNGPNERRILFSVWSPFNTDDPKSIPEDKRIKLLRKGAHVSTGEFGNEGSGGQSFLRYKWKAGDTYKFLLHASVTQDSSTIYTAYLFMPENKSWQLIASFSRPKTSTYLRRLHSFLENFIPETGDQSRSVKFGNQWVCDVNGKWTELNEARFTFDNTAKVKFRLDYFGAVDNRLFILKNCGFFNDNTSYNKSLIRTKTNYPPKVDFKTLP